MRSSPLARVTLGVFIAASIPLPLVACSWNPSRPFDREAPLVKQAVADLGDGGDAQAAAALLEGYLSTGACKEGAIGTPALVSKKADGTFDLGLSLFRIGESYGERFGDEEFDSGAPNPTATERGAQVGCALKLLEALHPAPLSPELRARALYLEGNLHFLQGDYEAAVHSYDAALVVAPGQADAGDAIGRDAAWNRAIALRRIEDKKDAQPPDAGGDAKNDPDGSPDGGPPDGGNDAGGDSGKNDDGGKKDDDKDAGNDSGKNDSPDGGGNDAGGNDAGPPPDNGDAPKPPPPKASQDDRILDQLENAPTLQQEAAKRSAAPRKVRGMADK